MPDSPDRKEFMPASLEMLKQADGTYRWVLMSSSSFEDRDKEIISQRALERDIERADKEKNYGPLLYWHLNGRISKDGEQLPLVVLGEADFNAMHGKVLIESGTFISESVALAVEKEAPNLEVSIAFEFPLSALDAQGVIHEINRYERSLLPRGVGSNRVTALAFVHKESPMLKDKVKALKELLGGNEEFVSQVLQLSDKYEKEATAAGLRSKESAKDKKDEDEKVTAEDKPNGESAEADNPFPPKVSEDDEDPKKDDDDKKGMSKKEFDAALVAVVSELERVKADLHILTTANAEKEKRDVDALTAVKALAETAQNGVLELKGELPRRLGDPLAAYRPSTHGKTPTEDKLKQVTPAHDPWAKHMDALLPSNNPFVPPGN